MSKSIATVLRKEGVILGIYTNNLAAYNQLVKITPDPEKESLPSYSTINRIVQDPGNSKAIATSSGIIIIQKLTVYKKAF